MKLLKFLRPNLESVAKLLLDDLGVNVNRQTIGNCLLSHPEYPSLLALSDCLSGWNVVSEAYMVAREDYQVDDLQFPFIAHLKGSKGRFILVHQINNDSVQFSDEQHDRSEIRENSFLNLWDGIILFAIKNSLSGEDSFFRNRIRYILKKGLGISAIVLFTIFFYFVLKNRAFSLNFGILLSIKLSGIAISTLLIIQSLNSDNPFLKKLCGVYNKSDCKGVLDSKEAKIFEWISWSEVGFFYFLITCILLIFIPESTILIKYLNILALPYTLYSLGYQYINKKWCVLCCTVQVLLWLEFFSFLTIDLKNYWFNFSYYPVVFVCILVPIILWVFLKPFFNSYFELKTVRIQLKRFKANNEIFYYQLHNQTRHVVGEDLFPITFGNNSAETILTIVSNPFCAPCLKAHKIIQRLLANGKDFQVKVLFANGKFDNEYKTKVGVYLKSLGEIDDRIFSESALNDWYSKSNQNFDKWQKKYPITVIDHIEIVQKKHREWFGIAEITSTPTIFINGYKLPELYTIEDLEYIL